MYLGKNDAVVKNRGSWDGRGQKIPENHLYMSQRKNLERFLCPEYIKNTSCLFSRVVICKNSLKWSNLMLGGLSYGSGFETHRPQGSLSLCYLPSVKGVGSGLDGGNILFALGGGVRWNVCQKWEMLDFIGEWCDFQARVRALGDIKKLLVGCGKIWRLK